MKKTMVISAPVTTFSGYGANSREKVKTLIELYGSEYDIKILPQRWGSTPLNFIDENPKWKYLEDYFLNGNLTYQPDVWIQITIPSEFQKVGKHVSIGITAGIETTICDHTWIEGVNRMDFTIVPSQHSKTVFENSKFQTKEGNVLELNKPVMVIPETIDESIFKILKKEEFTNTELYNKIDEIPESFAYLFCSHWIGNTPIGEDRKNITSLIKIFYETFKNKKNKPALILKTSLSNSSYTNRTEILKRINIIKNMVNSKDLPNIYLLHGDMKDEDINELYNHPKVKAMVNITKGEGFGRTFLEFSFLNKPIITSNWSGHIDFLNKDFTTLIDGTLTPIHKAAQMPNMLIEGSGWFSVNVSDVNHYLKDINENYKKYAELAKRQGYYSRTNFSYEKTKTLFKETFDKQLSNVPQAIALKLPQLKKVNLPTLKKIE
jgi:glycosyltransferase involved in cell wall biosynthesis